MPILPGLEQSGYVLLNLRGGVELANGKITLSVFGSNLTDEKYIVSTGNTGSLSGDPTQIAGTPLMFGAKITWKIYNFSRPK